MILIADIGSNLINTTVQKITYWVHLATITMVQCDLVIITAMRNRVNHYFGLTRLNNLVMPILLSMLILLLTGENILNTYHL